MTKYSIFKIWRLELGKAHFEELLRIRGTVPIAGTSVTLQMGKTLDRAL